MRRVLQASALSVLAGLAVALSAKPEQGLSAFTWILVGFFLMGLGGGLVESVINPLVGALNPNNRVTSMNRLHAWWPGGIFIGALVGVIVSAWGWDWRAMLALAALPNGAMLIFLPHTTFPVTERSQAGIPAKAMLRACIRPGFLCLCVAMAFTAVTELVPGPWIDVLLTRSLGIRGIWLVMGVALMQFFLRRSQGLLKGLAPENVLAISCTLAALGLVCLSRASSPMMGILGSLLWGAGACFLWPTLMVLTGERHPRSGALGLAVVGTCGVFADFGAQPWFGALFDSLKIAQGGGAAAFASLNAADIEVVLVAAARESFWRLAALPAVMVPVFLGLRWLRR
jgi:fucose permease